MLSVSVSASAFLFSLALVTLLLFDVITASSATTTETLIGIVGRDFILLGADTSISQSVFLTASNLDKIALLSNPLPAENSGAFLENPQRQQAIAAAVAGDAADADRVVGYLKAYAAIQEYEKGVGCDVEFYDSSGLLRANMLTAGLTTHGMANFARQVVYQQLRSRTPLKVGMLIAGMMAEQKEDESGPITLDDDKVHISISGKVQQQVHLATSFVPLEKSWELSGSKETPNSKSTSESALRPHLYWLDEYGSLQRMKEYGVHGHASMFLWSILDKSYRPDMSLSEAHALLQKCFQQLRQRYLINQAAAPPCIKCIDARGCRLISQVE